MECGFFIAILIIIIIALSAYIVLTKEKKETVADVEDKETVTELEDKA